MDLIYKQLATGLAKFANVIATRIFQNKQRRNSSNTINQRATIQMDIIQKILLDSYQAMLYQYLMNDVVELNSFGEQRFLQQSCR